MEKIELHGYGLNVAEIHRNLSTSVLYEHAIRYEREVCIADNGALVAYSGAKTGRSPKDKRVVREPDTDKDIWWGKINIPMEPESFIINRERTIDYLNTRDRLYVVDGFAGWDPKYRLKVRIVCSRPYHALFMHCMLIRPTRDELNDFGEPDYVIFNAGSFPANRHREGLTSKTSINLNFKDKEMIILGTDYAGEMKKGVFTIMNYLMPKRGIVSMHCSATANKLTGSSSLLFGLSGTGKTTLSADPKRQLIGDDEHCWTDKGIFNIEGGCYAKTIDITEETEPDIFRALRFGAVLENVILDQESHKVDYTMTSITENTRGAYPIEFIPTARVPCEAGHPTDIIFLTCDAYGVLPPVSALTPAQAMYHFISGYTARVAGTEVGVTEPQVAFSPCFGGPFLAWHPSKYAELLAEQVRKHKSRVWLVNTGWSGGPYGVGQRMKLSLTRAIVDAIHEGKLKKAKTKRDPIFRFEVVQECPEVPSNVLSPKKTWKDKAAYDATARKLAVQFCENFEKYKDSCSAEIRSAGPVAP